MIQRLTLAFTAIYWLVFGMWHASATYHGDLGRDLLEDGVVSSWVIVLSGLILLVVYLIRRNWWPLSIGLALAICTYLVWRQNFLGFDFDRKSVSFFILDWWTIVAALGFAALLIELTQLLRHRTGV